MVNRLCYKLKPSILALLKCVLLVVVNFKKTLETKASSLTLGHTEAFHKGCCNLKGCLTPLVRKVLIAVHRNFFCAM